VFAGELAFFTFDDAGQITTTIILGRDAVAIAAPARRPTPIQPLEHPR
jgi:hypothetical protein